jgi:hypothetical protein
MAAAKQTEGKSKKQLYMIAGLGVFLVVILAIQLPRLLGGGSEAAPTSTSDSVPAAQDSSGTDTSTTTLGGVAFVPGLAPKPGDGQLASFSLFDAHDPFVQVVKDIEGAGASQDGEPTGVKVTGGASQTGSSSGSAGPSGSTSTVPDSSALTSATIWVNGTDEAVDVKKKFPKADPTFVLVSLKSKVAKIGVVGGAFTGGGTITLKMGQTLTLVNTTTGGSEPEKVQQFTQANG